MPPGQTYPGQQPGMPPGQTYPGQQPGQAPPKKSKTGLIVGLVLGGLVVIGGGAGAAAYFLMKPGVLPVAVGNLPSKTKSFSRSSLNASVAEGIGIAESDVPKEAIWSYYARTACGGQQDLFDSLMDAPLGKVKGAAKIAAAKPEDLRAQLLCGKAVAGDTTSYFVSFEHDDKRQFVTLVPLPVDTLPDEVKRLKNTADPSSMSGARCMVPSDKPDDADCSDTAVTIAKLEGTKIWVRGLKDDLKAFGADYSADGSNKSSKLDEMLALAKELASYPVTRVEQNDSFSASDISLRGDGVSMYDEDEAKKLKQVVEDDASMIGVGGKPDITATELKMVFVGKSESGAKSIESSLKDFHSRLKEKIEEARKKEDEKKDEDKSDKKIPKRLEEFIKVKTEMARRALEDATISRDGTRVELAIAEKPKGSDQKTIDKFVKWRKKQVTIATKIVSGLLDGKAPGDDDLKELGGKDLVSAIEQQKKYAKWGGLEPEPWFAVDGFKVPGGGKYDSASLDGVTFHVFKYDMDKAKLQEIFEEIAKDNGWTIEKDSDKDIYKASKGDQTVSVTYGSPKDGGSTLVLVH